MIKTKVEFTIVEDDEEQIKDLGLSDKAIRIYYNKKEEIYNDYIKTVEDSIRKEFENKDRTIIENFKAIKVEE